MDSAFLDVRQPSLARANTLVFVSMALALWLSDFPNNRATLWLLIPALMVTVGTVDTLRCIGRHRSLRYVAVILCIYMDLMAATVVFFALLYPYIVILHGGR